MMKKSILLYPEHLLLYILVLCVEASNYCEYIHLYSLVPRLYIVTAIYGNFCDIMN